VYVLYNKGIASVQWCFLRLPKFQSVHNYHGTNKFKIMQIKLTRVVNPIANG
jgi:hypothetical protein